MEVILKEGNLQWLKQTFSSSPSEVQTSFLIKKFIIHTVVKLKVNSSICGVMIDFVTAASSTCLSSYIFRMKSITFHCSHIIESGQGNLLGWIRYYLHIRKADSFIFFNKEFLSHLFDILNDKAWLSSFPWCTDAITYADGISLQVVFSTPLLWSGSNFKHCSHTGL